MPVVSVVFGLLLIAVGVWGYWGGVLGLWQPLGLPSPDRLSGTALIPAAVGIPLVVCGLLAFKESRLKHAMHGAAMFGLLGFMAAGYRLIATLVRKSKVEGVSGVSQTGMLLLCGVFVALCINSFIQARRRRRAAEALTRPQEVISESGAAGRPLPHGRGSAEGDLS
ncbi:MAG: hypothetical protein ACRELG_27765 [Gemmataceae bacterium]